MATAVFVPCKVLSVVTGLNVSVLILLVGLVATAYTVVGGMKAVMWTDVIQFFVLFGSILLGVAMVAMDTPGGFSGLLRTGVAAGLIEPFYPFDSQIFSPDPRIRITLWSCWIGAFTAFMARYGADQVVVQRYFTAKSLRSAQKGFRLNYMSAVFALLSLALLGLAIHAYASSSGILGEDGAEPIFYFGAFVRSLPSGATGFVVAGLFSATLSSVDSGINSCCAAFVTDFYDRFARPGEGKALSVSRLVTLGLGTLVIFAALNIGRLGSVFEIANKVVNGFGSPLLAILLLGIFSRRANSYGMLFGGALGAVWSAYVSFGVENLALHYYAVVNLLGTLVLCYLFSLIENYLMGEPTIEQTSWTWLARPIDQREREL
jgi:SSS family transporter